MGSPTGAGTTPTSNANATTTTTAGNVLEGSKPFEVLRDLLCHHAHLAVFMNFVISQDDPSALVSSLINFALITLLLTFRVNHVLLEHYLN